MSLLFMKVLRQAFKTFDKSNQAAFNSNFATLKQLTDQLTFRDINIQPQQLEAIFQVPGRAPCSYMQIYENDIVSMSVFVLRDGYTMPLHDHPCMHGLLRGIFGQLSVQCYTKQPLLSNEPMYDRNAREVYVHAEPLKIVNHVTECAVLTPSERNYHEITAVDGIAAFFDILSPPYEAEIPGYGVRDCHFYRVASKAIIKTASARLLGKENQQHVPLIRLERIPAPVSYYCDTIEPSKEVAQCTFICSAEAYSAKS